MRSGYFRVILSMVLAALMLSNGLAVQAHSLPQTADQVQQISGAVATVRSSGAQAYAGPGTGFWRLGRLRANLIVPIIGVSADRQFWQLNTAIGVVWVSAADVVASGTEGVPTIDVGRIGRSTVNSAVRVGAGVEAARLAVLPRGGQFYILGTNADGSWLRIRFEFGEGWIATTNTDQVGTITPDAPNAPDAPDLPRTDVARAVVSASALNLRSGPGDFFTSLGVLAQGATFPILARTPDGAWLQVETDFGKGWLNVRFLRTLDYFGRAPIIRYADAAADGIIAGTTRSSTNLRKGPNLAFDSIGVIPPNTEVAILGQSPDRAWWLVKTDLGEGWVNIATLRTRGGTNYVPVLP
jgi:N-acetylmuramoyl-L-alanine amidase